MCELMLIDHNTMILKDDAFLTVTSHKNVGSVSL